MYRAQVGARVADGVASHGSVDAYIGDFHACSKAFEMFVADRLSDAEATGRRFLLWEDLDAATKEARGLTKADAGVDVSRSTCRKIGSAAALSPYSASAPPAVSSRIDS